MVLTCAVVAKIILDPQSALQARPAMFQALTTASAIRFVALTSKMNLDGFAEFLYQNDI